MRLSLSWLLVALLLPLAASAADPTPIPTPRPIYFASGAGRGTVGGNVMRGQPNLYSFIAAAGQVMTVTMTAPDDNAIFQIFEPGTTISRNADGTLEFKGKALHAAGSGEDPTRWRGRLPDRGTYLIVVESTRGQARYSIDIRID